MANINTKCEYCGEKVCNGVGPSGLPHVTSVLNITPSGSFFFDDACQHDIDYHIQVPRAIADKKFLNSMRLRTYSKYPKHRKRWYDWINPINGKNFALRNYFLWRADRMYWWVNKFGEEAYKAGSCVKAPH